MSASWLSQWMDVLRTGLTRGRDPVACRLAFYRSPYDLATNRAGQYRSSLRSAFRGFWTGVFDYDQFFDAMFSSIQYYLPRAWYAGAAREGLSPGELNPAERTELAQAIFSEINQVGGLASWIEERTKAAGGKLGAVLVRAERWAQRYSDLEARGALLAARDKKKQWRIDQGKENCTTCLKLNGKVKRASQWQARVQPRNYPNPALECGGWKCGCVLEDTDEPMSKGPLPNVP